MVINPIDFQSARRFSGMVAFFQGIYVRRLSSMPAL